MAALERVLQLLLLFPVLIHDSLAKDLDLTILHTNDVHSRVEQFNLRNAECSQSESLAGECFGGVARRYTAIQKERKVDKNLLLLDAGDQFMGTPWFYHYEGLEAAHFMNTMQYDAMALGHHEFDFGVTGLETFLQNVAYQALSCNVDASNENDTDIKDLIKPWADFLVKGERVGVVGYTPAETASLVNPEGIANLKFLDETEQVRKAVDEMTAAGINKIIALGHQGFDLDVEMAKAVKGIDVIVGGRTNTFLYTGNPPSEETPSGPYPYVVNVTFGTGDDVEMYDVLIVHDYAFGKYLGKLKVSFDDDGYVTGYEGNPILLDGSIEQDEGVLETVEQWSEEVNNATEAVLGDTRVFLDGEEANCRQKECNMGNLLTDAMLFSYLKHSPPIDDGWSDISVAIWNGGAIRGSVNDGGVNLKQIVTVFPFHNTMDSAYVKGSTLKKILENSVSKWTPEKPHGAFLQVAGLEVEYDVDKPVGQRVRNVNVRCAKCLEPSYMALDEDETYGVIMNTFLLNGGDGYTMIGEELTSRRYIGKLVTDALAEYIAQYSPIMHGLDGRINFCSASGCHINPIKKSKKCGAASTSISLTLLVGVALLSFLW